jgi:hypothetical protein
LCNSGNSFKAQRSARETHDGNWAKFVQGWAKSVEIHSTLPSKGGSTGSALALQFDDAARGDFCCGWLRLESHFWSINRGDTPCRNKRATSITSVPSIQQQ